MIPKIKLLLLFALVIPSVFMSHQPGALDYQGGRFGGWHLYVKGNRPVYTYNFVGLQEKTITGSAPLPSGKATIIMDFDYEGGRGKGGNVTLSVNGKKVGKGRIERTEPNAFYADDLAVVGVDEEHMLVKPTMIMETSLRAKLRKSGWTLNKSLSVRLNSFK